MTGVGRLVIDMSPHTTNHDKRGTDTMTHDNDTSLHRRVLTATIAATLLLATGTVAADESSDGPTGPVPAEVPNVEDKSFDELAERLAELRSEVDSLSSKVEQKKQRMTNRLRSIQRQRSDVELKIEQTRSEVERLRKSVREKRQTIEEEQTAADELTPAVASAIETVRENVRHSPPFKRDERLAELDKLESQMEEGLLSPQKTVSRLWQFVEDELRLARESGLYRQAIELDGEEVLAEVARVGMVMLYFETDDGRMGVARRTDEGWRWRPVDGEETRRQIEQLFDSFDKGIRVGFFTLPSGLRGIERFDEERR
jgi:hypothetical protein